MKYFISLHTSSSCLPFLLASEASASPSFSWSSTMSFSSSPSPSSNWWTSTWQRSIVDFQGGKEKLRQNIQQQWKCSRWTKQKIKQTPAVPAGPSPLWSLSLGVAFLVSTAMEASLALRFLMASRRRRKNLESGMEKRWGVYQEYFLLISHIDFIIVYLVFYFI